MTTGNRNQIFDAAKGIGILLVVYGHVARGLHSARLPMNEQAFQLIDSLIYSFHMPLFFFLSGMLFPASLAKYGRIGLIRSKVDTVLYPYLVWSLAQGFLELALASETNGKVTVAQILSLLWQPRAQFWFLYVLFAVFLVAVGVYRRTTITWAAWAFLVAAGAFAYGALPIDVYALSVVDQWFVYFAFGILVSRILPLVRIDLPLAPVATISLFVAGQWVAHSLYGSTLAGAPSWWRLPLAVSGIAAVMALAARPRLCRMQWLSHIGRHSMEIYLVHIIAGSGARIVLSKVFGINEISIHLIIGILSGVAIPLLVVAVAPRLGLRSLFTPPARLSLRAAPQTVRL